MQSRRAVVLREIHLALTQQGRWFIGALCPFLSLVWGEREIVVGDESKRLDPVWKSASIERLPLLFHSPSRLRKW